MMGYLISISAFSFLIAFILSKLLPMISNVLRSYYSSKDQKHALQNTTNITGVKNAEATTENDSTGSNQDEELTPKSIPVRADVTIPVLTLGDADESQAQSLMDETSPISTQIGLRSQTEKVMNSSKAPQVSQNRVDKPASSLMPPPARPTSLQNPKSASSLRVPSTGPLPNRGLPTNSQQRISSATRTGGLVNTANSRGKVLLSPGHSPMDWAALTRRSNLSGVETFKRVTPSELRSMTGRKGKPAWSTWQNKVYNITPYLPFHPGGEAELMKAAGRDGTKLFMEIHPWVNWENMLESCLVGILVPEFHEKGGESSLEDLD